jgi:tripartite-type tricarboxylate transporter receptor subunit TctC
VAKLKRRDLILHASSALALMALLPSSAVAQPQYPGRPIRLIVPFVPGGVGDIVARIWADQMTALLGTVVIENRGGASGVIGTTEAARAEPDGYTILLGNTSTQVLNPVITTNPPYDALKDFVAISIIANSPISVAVNPAVPAKSFHELIAYIKANPGKVSYGTAGTGTITNLAGELFKQVAETPDVTHIPYKGGGQVISDVISGHIPMMMVAITNSVLELHRTGKIRIVTVFSAKRLSVLPDVQAAPDTDARLVAGIFMGLFAPAATPPAIVQQIGRATRLAGESDEFRSKLIAAGFDPLLDTPGQAQQFLAAEHRRIFSLVKSLNFRLP